MMAPRGYVEIEIRGVVYPDVAVAVAALGIDKSTIRRAIRGGTLARVGLGQRGVVPMRVRIAGRVFETARAAAEHYGVGVTAIYGAIADGDPDRIARPQHYRPWKSKPIEIGGVRYSSMRSASIALGFASRGYVAKARQSGCRVAAQRIMAAAMKMAAQRDAGAMR